jgi:mRNA-degrading endonuclease toxin of MazEF toxin-antitoxin module
MRPGELRWVGEPDQPRPVLIVQAGLFEDAPARIVLPVTLKELNAPWPFNVRIGPGTAGLTPPAWARLMQPFTVPCAQLGGLIGTLPDDTFQEVLAGLALILGIPSDISPPAPRP